MYLFSHKCWLSPLRTFISLAMLGILVATAASEGPEQIIVDTSMPPPSLSARQATIPTAFDTTLGTNFSSPACLHFLTSFLSNDTFQSCLPISLLLTTSTGFFTALRNPSTLPDILDQACNTDCTILISSIATQLQSSNNCGADLSQQNPIVQTAMNGLAAYPAVRDAACLKTPTIQQRDVAPTTSNITLSNPTQEDTYCLVSAASNRSSPASLYPYFLALGMPFPSISSPACTPCLHSTMSSLSNSLQFASNAIASSTSSSTSSADASPSSTSPETQTVLVKNLGRTFPDAASLIAQSCGASFAGELSLAAAAKQAVEKTSDAPDTRTIGIAGALSVALTVVGAILL